MNYLIFTFIGGILWLNICDAVELEEMTATTSKPVAVDAREDNAIVLQQTEPGLVVSMTIDGAYVIDFNVQFASISKSAPTKQNVENVNIRGMIGGIEVSSASIADQRFKAAEEVGLVMTEKRTLIGRLAVFSRIDTIEVYLPGSDGLQKLDVRQAFKRYCAKYDNRQICSIDSVKQK